MIGNGAINNNPTFNWIKNLERGVIFAYPSNGTVPDGALICNGSAISRSTYNLLFAKIGTTYGSGNGSTTFNLPNLTNKFIQGSGTAGTNMTAGLPDHTHFIANTSTSSAPLPASGSSLTNANYLVRHAFSGGNDESYIFSGNATKATVGKTSSASYSKSSTVQPPALTMRYYIKY